MRENWRLWWSLHWLTVILVTAWLVVMIGGLFIGGGGSDGAPDPTDWCEPVSAYAADC